jgi:orotidine-5'-phosphate decarboxylase
MSSDAVNKPVHQSAAEKIIVALDVPNTAEALQLCDQLPEVQFWKVGLELFIAAGHEILPILKERQKKIFLDLKLHDIPNTVGAACRVAAGYGVDFLTIHGIGGKAMLEAAQTEVFGTNTQLLAVTLLTSIPAAALRDDMQVNLSVAEYVEHLAKLAQSVGIAGSVCSPQELDQLRPVLSDSFQLVTPGIRSVGVASGDQQRTLTPKAALGKGANYLVIGRQITTAADPAAAWEELMQEIAS